MAKQSENNAMKMEVYRKINLQNSTMMDQYQEKKRIEDRSVLIDAQNRVRELQAQRRIIETNVNDPSIYKKDNGYSASWLVSRDG